MAISKDLFLAILSMDAYNRGYNVGINGLGDGPIGNATISRQSDVLTGAPGVGAGFYAIAYDTSGVSGFTVGEKTVAIRGTDSIFSSGQIGSDLWNAYGVGLGSPGGKQAELAINFYKAVAGSNWQGANVSLTGHSAGGGLAGLVAGLYGKSGAIFDNMAFEDAVRYAQITSSLQPDDPAYNAALTTLIYGSSNPWASNFSNLLTNYVHGEFLYATRRAQSTPEVRIDIEQNLNLAAVTQLHSQSLLVILKYAEEAFGFTGDWSQARKYFAPALFDERLGQLIVRPDLRGTSTSGDVMRDAIAYSVIDEGIKIFGSTGARALLDDAGNLGSILNSSAPSKTVSDLAAVLGTIMTQFAGQLALGKVEQASQTTGVFSVGNNLLTVDLAHDRWVSVENTDAKIIGRNDLLKALYTTGGMTESEFNGALGRLWSDPTGSKIDEAIFVTKNEAFSGSAPTRATSAAVDGVTLFLTSGQNDTVVGTDKNDGIFGGDGVDTITGGKGKDLLIGGAGNDILNGGEGNDLLLGADDVDILHGGADNDELWGGAGTDKLLGGVGNDLVRGGTGDDTIFADVGNDDLYGDQGTDTYRYQSDTDVTEAANAWDTGIALTLTATTGPSLDGQRYAVITADATGADTLIGMETVEFTNGKDTLIIEASYNSITGKISFDGLEQTSGTRDILDLSHLTGGVNITSDGDEFTLGDLSFKHFEELILTSGDDTVAVGSGVEKIYAGTGNDTVKATGGGAIIDLGDGNDTLVGNGKGTIVYTGDGNDRIEISHNGQMLVADASTLDRMTMYGVTLTGGIHWHASESPWAYGQLGERYGRNQEGNLVIADWRGNETFISNFNFSIGGNNLTAGIYVIDLQVYFRNIMHLPSGFDILDSWEALMGHAMKAMTGHSMWGTAIDPLMFDLNGDGISLSPREANNASFDIDGDGFAEEVGWARGGDGFLVRDINGNGKIDDIKEMFGNQFQSGFEQLALLDGNHDGKIDETDDGLADFNRDGVIEANDTFDTLKMWIDRNEDGKTDAGELVSLGSLGIASISVTSTPSNTDLAGNIIVATGTYTKTDGSTGTVAHVDFKVNDFNSVWLGDHTISTEAAALPDIKGHGTLTDLRVAMTIADGLVDVVDDNLQFLNSTNLATLRLAARPILTGWASAVPVPAGTPGFTPREDFNLVVEDTVEGPVVRDFLISKTDSQGTYWALASGHSIKDASDVVIARPTREQVLSSVPDAGEWTVLAGSEINFLERFLGDEIALDVTNNPGTEAIAAASTVLNFATHQLNEIVVRLAAQGPLKEFFAGIEYDIAADIFKPTTDQQLVPMLEAIFAAAPTDTAGALDFVAGWKTIISVMLPDFERGGVGLQTTYAYLFQNLVGAYENVPIAISLQQTASVLNIPEDAIRVGSGTVLGTNDADLFYMDSSNQVAKGSAGYDAYVVGRDFGTDVIQDVMEGLGDSQEDSIRFAHLNQEELHFRRDGVDLVITQIGTQNEIRVVDEFAGRRPGLFTAYIDFDTSVEIITFADGTVWDKLEIARQVGMPSFATDDILIGTGDVDFLNGGAGTDVMSGGNAGDHYMFGRGDGHDLVQDNQSWFWQETPDFLHFGDDITLGDLWFQRMGDSNDLQMGIVGTDDVITIGDQFGVGYGLFNTMPNRIEIFTFDDGSYIDWEYIIKTLDMGTDGDDVIYGFAYEDVLDGGKGDDFLSGGNENDTYIFGRGYGHDTIRDHLTMILSGNDDTVQFKEGVNRSDVTLSRAGDSGDLRITINETGDVLDILGQFNVIYGLIATRDDRIEYFKFGDGTVINWEDVILQMDASAGTDNDDIIYGFSYADVLEGGKGDDYLNGGADNDVYIYSRGDGIDVIQEDANAQAPAFDTLRLNDIVGSDISFVRNGNDLTLVIAETVAGAGDGGTILLKDELDDWFARGIENVSFADGTTWTQADLRLKVLAAASTAGDDHIDGFNTNDVMRGGQGNDTLNGGAGDDTYIWARGDGNDVIIEGGGGNFSTVDTLRLEAVSPSDVALIRNGNDLTLVISETVAGAGDGGTILLKDELDAWFARGVENISFADGTTWTQADLRVKLLAEVSTSGDDHIDGFNTNDVVQGGQGNDTLNGGAGDDTYIWARGDGSDVIIEGGGGNYSTVDTLRLEAVSPSDVALIRNGNDLTLVIAETVAGAGDGGTILLKDELDAWFARGVENVSFADGTTWTQADLRLKVLAAASSSGDDYIEGFNTNDVMRGGVGNDSLDGGAGDDTYIWARGDGHDTIIEGPGGNFSTFDTLRLEGILSSSVSITRAGNDVTLTITESAPGANDGGSILLKDEFNDWFSRGVEQIIFADGTIWTQTTIRTMLITASGTAGDDIITGSSATDVIDGGTGNDVLSGGAGDDTYIYARGDGHDVIIEDASGGYSDALMLEGINPSDISFVRNGNDVTLIIAESAPGADNGGSILLKEQLDNWYERGVDRISFSDGTIWTPTDLRIKLLEQASTPGNNVIDGFNTNDVIRAGGGDDTINGGAGDDTYLYSRGDGHDLIVEGAGGGSSDTLVLEGINPSDISFVRNGNDVTLIFAESAPGAGNGGSILLKEQLDNWYDRGVDRISFADGSIWTQADLRIKLLEQVSTSGNDVIDGFNTNDAIRAGGGDDTISGGSGDDTYLYSRGDGHDVITEGISGGSSDTLVLEGIDPSDVSIVRNNNDITLIIAESASGAGNGGSILLKEVLDNWYDRGLDRISFANGVVWTQDDLRSQWLAAAPTAGNDVILGFNGDDVIRGAGGDDLLSGYGGSDTYIYSLGDGNDIIDDQSSSGMNTLVLHGIAPADVTAISNGNDVILLFGDNGAVGRIKIKDQAASNAKISTVTFDDGTVWTDQTIASILITNDGSVITHLGTSASDDIAGTVDNDVFDGRGGADTLRGMSGNDTYLFGFGSGNDVIVENNAYDGGGGDRVRLLGLNVVDIQLTRSGNDLFVKILSSAETLKIENQFNGDVGIEQIIFDDGTLWDRSQIRTAAWLVGSSNSETIDGSNVAETLDGLGGNDRLVGHGGNDTYIYGVGSGDDTIVEGNVYDDGGGDIIQLRGLNIPDVELRRSGNDLYIKILSSGETLRVENQFNGDNGIEQIVFEDGTIWDRSQIQAAAWFLGTSGSEEIYGSNLGDTFDGLGGNDRLVGRAGNDTYIYGLGSGNDTIVEGNVYDDGGGDIIQLRSLNIPDVEIRRSGNDLYMKILSSGETLRVENQFNGDNGIEQLLFSDGVSWGRNQIQAAAWFLGTSGSDEIYGSNLGDTFDGLGGNDRLVGRAGNDTYIYGLGSGNDTIVEGNVYDDGGGDIIQLRSLNIPDVEFRRSGNDLYMKILSSGEALRVENQFNGDNGIEQIVFEDGTIWDRSQIVEASWFRGGDGSDSINATADADILLGGQGNDFLSGKGGNDVYVYSSGDGDDRIDDSSGATTEIDTLKLTDLNASDVTFSRVGGDLQILVNGTAQTIKVEYQFYSQSVNWGIEKIQFADNTQLDLAAINAAAWYRGSEGDDSINGSTWNETLWGGFGNDFLSGKGGNDVYVYSSGDGNDRIDDSSGVTTEIDTLKLTNLNASDVTFSRVGEDLQILVNGTAQTIKVEYQFYSQSANWGIEKIEFADGSNWDLATINSNAWIRGTSGVDSISGTSWSDTIFGGAGNDQLSGGAGDDAFVFGSGFGQDTISDFTAGHDKLEFRDGMFVDAAAAFASATAQGSDTIITVDASMTVLLQNVALANLHVDDFRVV